MDWLLNAIRSFIAFCLSSILWYVWHVGKTNARKNLELAEETNKKRIAEGKPALIAEEIRCLLRRKLALHSLLFGFLVTVGIAIGYVLVDWGIARFFG